MHGLLSVKHGNLSFAKRVRRLAQLTNGVLELRLNLHGPVEWSTSVLDLSVRSDPSALCIALTGPSLRLRLYAPSDVKFALWEKALRSAATWKVNAFYDIGDKVQNGVYRARDRETGQVVAVKAVVAGKSDAPEFDYAVEAMRRECRIARLVQHHTIAPVRDVFEGKEHADIVMDYFTYTLHDVMAAHTVLSEAHAAAVIRKVLTGVAYLHNRNIVHRDIKPDNVLCNDLYEPRDVRICDFGMANFIGKRVEIPMRKAGNDARIPKRLRTPEIRSREDSPAKPFGNPVYLPAILESSACTRRRKAGIGFHSNRDCGMESTFEEEESDKENSSLSFGFAIDGLTLTSAIGAPSYVAPELVKGHRYGKPVDVWGCGVLLFLMLSGYLPFEGRDAAEVLRRIRNCQPDFSTGSWGRVSEKAKAFVKMLLHADPLKRITAESALENEWLVLNTVTLEQTLARAL